MITGNGTLGAMVSGEALDESIILNHAQLFMPRDKPLQSVALAAHLAEIRRALHYASRRPGPLAGDPVGASLNRSR